MSTFDSIFKRKPMPAVQTEPQPELPASERAGYFEVPGAHLFTVLHEADAPIGCVLLVGSFATERHYSYIPWVRWARYLAARNIECLRYDYRGMGESTGLFEEMSFREWTEDVELLATWLKKRRPELPLILHGLELGAILAGAAFRQGIGDGLLAWSPPNSALELLQTELRRRIMIDNAFKPAGERKLLSDYVQELETQIVEVDGYRWSSRMWRDAFNFKFDLDAAGDRSVKTVQLPKTTVPLVHGTTYETINPDLSTLYAETLEWITSSVAKNEAYSHAAGD